MVGSEGTLAFLSEVTMKTLHDYQFKASAMVYFLTMKESCEAVVAMKKLKAGEEDLEMSAENLMVKSAEMLDYKSLSSVDDPVFLKYKEDVDAGKIEGVEPGDYHNLTAILTETKGITHEQLLEKIEKIKSDLTDVYSTFGDGDLSKAQEMSAATKSSIEAILKKYPGNCEAQLAYTATINSDIANNKKINNLIDTLLARTGKPGAALFSRDMRGSSEVSFNLAFHSTDELRGILVSDAQAAIATVIPSLDSAIGDMTNIANDDEFTCTYNIDERDIELDRGEFAPVLAALYAAKATLTAIVSLNLNIDENGKYDWIDSLMELEAKVNYYDNHGFEHLFKFIGK